MNQGAVSHPIVPSELSRLTTVLATEHVRSQKTQFLPSHFAAAIRLFPPAYQGLLASGKAGCPDHESFSCLCPKCHPSCVQV